MKKLILLFAVELFAMDEFAKYKANIMQEFNNYYEKQMKEFESYKQISDGIENKTNPYQTMNILPSETIKKDIQNEPIKKDKNIQKDGTPSGSQLKTVDIKKINSEDLIKPDPVAFALAIVDSNSISIDFFGAKIEIKNSSIEFIKKISSITSPADIEKSIGSNSLALINEIKSYKNALDLNDFDTYILAQIVVNNIYKNGSELQKTILMINIIRHLGYNARFAEGKSKKPYILLSTKQEIFSKGFTKKDNKKYYLFHINSHPRASFTEGIYHFSSPDDTKGVAMDMVMRKDPKVGANLQQVKLNWDWKSGRESITVSVNRHLTDLMDMYPQVDYGIYMQSKSGAKLVDEIAYKLIRRIKELNLNEKGAVDFVLRFAQSAFAYKTDFEAYGYERPLFVEQTILLPYSDCEDRATLLSKLYAKIFGYESVGLQYKGHMALGVGYLGSGKHFYEFNSKKYFVVDGTYFYVNAGVSQPEFVGVKPKFVPTR